MMKTIWAKCGNCSAVRTLKDIVPLVEVKDLGARLTPGGEVPLGECKECGSLAYANPKAGEA